MIFPDFLKGYNALRLCLVGATLAWMGLIFYLSSLTQPETSQIPLQGNWQSIVGHLILYGVCAALMEGSVWSWVSGFRLRWTLVAIVGATAYGISDEFHQSFVSGRHATIEDVLVNTIGATMAAAGLWLIANRWSNRISLIEEFT
jgi:VanZ family protein